MIPSVSGVSLIGNRVNAPGVSPELGGEVFLSFLSAVSGFYPNEIGGSDISPSIAAQNEE